MLTTEGSWRTGCAVNREIEFRGKSLASGEWVYGYYYEHSPPMQGIVPKDYVNEKPESFILRTGFADWNMYRPIDFTEVDPKTVGQYTRMIDICGTKIFEGDIVGAWREGVDVKGVIKQRIDGLWVISSGGQDDKFWELKPSIDGSTNTEVLGDIYDNPELLEVE